MDPLLIERLNKLSPEKMALLMERLKTKDGRRVAPTTIPRRETTGRCPVSFAQQRLWFLEQLEPGGYGYNVLTVLRFDGVLNVAAMQQALNAVVERHEVLRTTFVAQDGVPMQVITSTLFVPIEVEDLRSMAPGVAEPEVRRLINEESRRPFDLATGPLLRAKVLRLGSKRHLLFIALHHIVSDGWSRGVLVREISEFYTAYLRGETATLPELPIQYADYALWQRERLGGEFLERELGYWTSRLHGLPDDLQLPSDRSRPAVQSFEGRVYRFRIDTELARAVRGLARQEQATPFIALLTVYKVLLYRYSGQCDIVVGTPVANRGNVETEGLVGFFANTLTLRTDLSGTPTFREALRRVRETALSAYVHEELPFERLDRKSVV